LWITNIRYKLNLRFGIILETMDLKEILYLLERETPNNMDLGNKVRSLVWEMKKVQSQEIADEQLPGQLDMFEN
jgi:hypothetical protein